MNDLSTCDILCNDNKEIHDLKIELTKCIHVQYIVCQGFVTNAYQHHMYIV